MSIWKNTPLANVSEQIWSDPKLRAAFHIGQAEQTVADIFGMGIKDENIPEVVQRFALVMVDALWGKRNWEDAAQEMAQYVREFRKGVN